MRGRVLLLGLSGMLVLGMFLSGCSGKTDEGKIDAVKTEASDAWKEAEIIKIGMIAPLTGEKAEFGKSMWISVEMAVDAINAEGGVLGRQVEVVKMDSKAEPKEAVEAAKKLVQDDEIVAVIGPMMSGEAIACAPVFEEAKVIELAAVANHSGYVDMGDYMFTLASSQKSEFPAMVEKQIRGYHHAQKVGVAYVLTDFGVSCFDEFSASCKEQGVSILAAESFPDAEKDFTALLTKIRQTNPELMVVLSQQIECAAILCQIREMGWDIPIAVLSTDYSDQTLQLAGEAAEGITSNTVFFMSEDNPDAWAYAQEFEKLAGYAPTVHGAFFYDAVGVLCDAIERAGTADRQAVFQALKTTDGYEGFIGPYRFTEEGYVEREYQVLKVQDGKWVVWTPEGF